MEIFHQAETGYFHIAELVRQGGMVYFSTMFEPSQILAIIEDRRKHLGLSQAEVSLRAFGKPDNTAIQSLKKGSSPAVDRVAALARALGLELYLGPPRESGELPPSPDLNDLATLPLHDAFVSAGPGAINSVEPVVDYVSFRRDWLKKIGTLPSNAVLVRASGDSMQPCISDGDMLLIDRADRHAPVPTRSDRGVRRAPIYALLHNGEAKVKRLLLTEAGFVTLISDNPDYQPQFAKADDLSIIGKVKWWGHTCKD